MHFVLLSNNHSHLSLLNIIPTESTVSSVLMWVCLGLDVKVRILSFSFVWGSNLLNVHVATVHTTYTFIYWKRINTFFCCHSDLFH